MITWKVRAYFGGTRIVGSIRVRGHMVYSFQFIPDNDFTHPVVPPADLVMHAMGKIERALGEAA